MFAYQILLDMARDEDLDADAVQAAAEKYVELAEVWGPRMVERARINVGVLMAQRHHVPDVALKWLDEAESNLTEQDPGEWLDQIKLARMDLLVGEALLKINDGTDEEREEAVKAVRQFQEDYKGNRLIQYALALYDEKTGNVDDAIASYTRLAVLPMVEHYFFQKTWLAYYKQLQPPTIATTRLWKEKHGSSQGLKEYIEKTYEEAMGELVAGIAKPSAELQGTRNVLCELFTGSRCQPCIAADVALDALASTYPDGRLIVLRYHQHVPGPDPLTNEDTISRFEFYGAASTPTVAVNGKIRRDVGGPSLALAGFAYQRLRQMIDPLLAEESPVQINAAAAAAGGVISISVDAEGVDETAESVRLRVVLAETDTQFLAVNGIRRHEMLVRAMPGGTAGIKPENGRFAFKREIEISELRQQLNDYLLAYEQVNRVKFRSKPLELKELRLVAFLQDDKTGEVLQATSVPVTGELETADAS